MSRRPSFVLSACGLLLRVASLVVPGRERREWLAEWRGELYYVLGRGVSHAECIAFSFGAVPDALWMGRHSPRGSWAPHFESPRECLAVLLSMAVASVALAMLLPNVRQEIFPPVYDGPTDLAILSPVPSAMGPGLDVSAAQYKGWSARPQHGISEMAFYEPTRMKARIGGREESWKVGRTSGKLADVLDFKVPKALLAECTSRGFIPIVLSRETWLGVFAADPSVAGRVLPVGGRSAMIVGIAPRITSDLPAREDAWALESEGTIRSLAFNPFADGFVIARISPTSIGGRLRWASRVELVSASGGTSQFYVIKLMSIAKHNRYVPEIDFLLALVVVCLMLPAVLPIFLRAGLRTERLSRPMRTRGWIFAGAKIALLLPLLYCGPVVLGQVLAGPRASGNALQTFATIGGALIAAFWAIDDQRQRCPSCLRRLTNPARVGERSRSFLNFSGMEYVCAEGHGLLHVPDFPTSWFDGQRWLTLDGSWSSLFQHGII